MLRAFCPTVTVFGQLVLAACAAGAAPWGWRGDGTGRYPGAEPPTEWSAEKNIVWKTKLPGPSHASPIIVGDSILVTAEPSQLMCLDLASGEIRWQQSHTYEDVFGPDRARKIEDDLQRARQIRKQDDDLHKELQRLEKEDEPPADKIAEIKDRIEPLRKQREKLSAFPAPKSGANGNTTGTPISDGRHVWAIFGVGIVSCHTLSGDRVWIEHIEVPHDGSGHTASPVLAGDSLVVHLVDLVALDPLDGREKWRTPLSARWGTPVATRLGQLDVLVTPGGSMIRIADGKELAKGLFGLSHCSPIVDDNIVYAVEDGKVKSVELVAAEDDALATKVRWEGSATRQRRFASPAVHDGLVYGITESGILDVTDAETGEAVYRQRTSLGKELIYPSVTVAGNFLYLCGNDGKALVVRPGREYDEVAENNLEKTTAAPIFSGRRMYIRGEKHLYCIGTE